MLSPASTEPPVTRAAEATYAALLAGVAGVGYLLGYRTTLLVFTPLAALAAWVALSAFAGAASRSPRFVRSPLLLLATVALVYGVARSFLPRPIAMQGTSVVALQYTTIAVFAVAFVLYFAALYGFALTRQSPAHRSLVSLMPLVKLTALAHAALGAVLLLRLYSTRNLLPSAALVLAVATLLLIAEASLRALASFYQPRRLRGAGEPFGRSVLLAALFGEAGPLRALTVSLEKSLGTRLGDAWLLRLARGAAAPFIFFGLIGLIASTAVTRVPVDSHGVLVHRGRFADQALAPGLHWHAPWPFARVEIVPTERVREIALGFERDLAGPVLWAEKHFEGEQNLLVGEGEELLTLNVPLHYRIRDAVAFLRHTGDPGAALSALGYRQLFALTRQHTSFGLMTTDRGEIASSLQRDLQADCDRLNLGIEIVFVGLKDVHPPVAVAPAYQDVISAEEERITTYDRAATERVASLAGAQSDSTLRRVQADTFATTRRLVAEGETHRFLSPLAVYREHSNVYTTRIRLETLEAVLAPVRNLLLLPSSQRSKAQLYLTPDANATFPAVPR